MKINYQHLQKKIKVKFKNLDLLIKSLTHKSFDPKKNNEKIEFLGDRVLGLVIADLIYKNFLNESEGDLARRIAFLVSGKTLSEIAIKLKLQNYVRVSENLKFKNGENNSILSDTMEAIIGAIFLDSSYSEVKRVIKYIWMECIKNDVKPPKDPKSALQELSMELKYEMPVYSNYIKEGPDHSPVFKVKVSIKGLNKSQGIGVSKKSAEIDAASKLLRIIESNSN